MWAPLLEYRRSGLADITIHGSIAWSSGNQELHFLGNSDPVFARSVVKPFQMKPLVKELNPIFNEKEKALALSSHNAEPFHLCVLESMLTEEILTKLATPESLPLMFAEGKKPSIAYHPCSGKHAALLRACEIRGWNLDNYTSTEHPFHKAYIKTLKKYLGSSFKAQHVAEDGCGLPTLSFTVSELAKLFSKLVKEKKDDWIWQAMTSHPELIGGTSRLDTEIMKACGDRVLAKEGADGLLALAIEHDSYPEGLGVAIKLAHGWDMKAMGFLAFRVLQHLGLKSPLPEAPVKQEALVLKGLLPLKPLHHTV